MQDEAEMEVHERGVLGDGERERGEVDGVGEGGADESGVMEGEVGEGDVIVEEGGDEGGNSRAEEAVDNHGDGEAEGVGGQGLPLVEAVRLEVELEGVANLDVGGGGKVVVGEEVEGEAAVEVVGRFVGDERDDEVGGLPGGGGVGVFDVERGGGEVGRAEVVEELVATRRGSSPSPEEPELAEAQVERTGMGGEANGEEAGEEATDNRVAGEGAGGGGFRGGERDGPGVLVWLALPPVRL